MNLLTITAADIDPAIWFGGLASLVITAALFDLGIAFLMRGTDEAAGDERH